MADPSIPHSEFESRRKKLLRALNKSVGVVFAGDESGHLEGDYAPHPHFAYLAGVTDEPGAILLLDPTSPIESRRAALFLRPLNPEREKWDGLRPEIGRQLRDDTGFQSIYRTDQFPRFLLDAAKRSRSLACLHPPANHTQPLPPDIAVFHKLAQRVPQTEIVDRSESITTLRSVKSSKEIAMIQRAIDITAGAFDEALRAIRPGMNEFDVQQVLHNAYFTSGARGVAFNTVVGSGINSTVLHYKANRKVIEDGDLICIDSGATFGPDGGAYRADVTLTVPANGTFSDRQREVYGVVLKALEAATKACKAGVTLADVDKTARAVIAKAGFGDFFIHSIGHHLGLETHDAAPGFGAKLQAGNVITIEPGVYLPDEAIGIRIEDDVVVTKEGCTVLTSKIPKSVAAIEKAMAG